MDRAELLSRIYAYKGKVKDDPEATQLLTDIATELSFEPVEDDPLVIHLLQKQIAILSRKLNDNGDHWCNGCSRLYVYDKHRKKIHRIGDDVHDALCVEDDGKIHYHNMQNGDGGTAEDVEGYGYVILISEDGGFCAPYVDCTDMRFEKEIKEYIEEVENGRSESNKKD